MTLLKRLVWASGLFVLSSAAAHAAVLEIREYDDVVYALTDNQTILRFDLASGSELPSITLAYPAQHFTVDGDEIITANNRELRSITITDGSVTYIGGTSGNVIAISTENQIILTAETDGYRTYSHSGQVISSSSGSFSNTRFLNERTTTSIVTQTSSRTCSVSISESNGPDANCTYLDTNNMGASTSEVAVSESLILLNSGYIVNTDVGTIYSRIPVLDATSAARIQDSILVVADSGEIEQYSMTGVKEGSYASKGSANYFTTYSDDYVGLNIANDGISADYYSPSTELIAASISRNNPELPDNASQIIPEKILTTQSGDAIIYDAETSGLYVWDLATDGFVAAYDIGNDAIDVIYDEYFSAIFSIHQDGYLRRLDISDLNAEVADLAYLPGDHSMMRRFSVFMDEIVIDGYYLGDERTVSPEGALIDPFNGGLYKSLHWSDTYSSYFGFAGLNFRTRTLNKRTYDTANETFSSSVTYSLYPLNDLRVTLLPELDVIALSNGQLISMDTMTNTRTLSSDIYDAAYPAASLVTVSADRSTLQIWSAAGELLNSIPQAANIDLRLVYDETFLGLIQVSDDGMRITRYNIASGEDTDSDTVSDLFDNCPQISNSDQADMDDDDIGDVCDPDEDGDGIPNAIENEVGLNPRDASDRDSDLDTDGMPNYYEYRIGTAINETSTPVLTGQFTIDFNDGLMPSYLIAEGGTWFTMADYDGDEGYDLRSPAASSDAVLPYVLFYADFDGSSDIIYEAYSNNSYSSSQTPMLRIYIDDIEHTELKGNGKRYVEGDGISTGTHSVKIELQVPRTQYSNQNLNLVLDNISYEPYIGPDYDSDGIPDTTDNCKYDSNPSQDDADSDGKGDVCDSYNDIDHDDDGIPNSTDNCYYDYNPAQEDTDKDGNGDACDDYINIDSDGDGSEDDYDNCPMISNSSQENRDGDELGDACDNDIDGDGVTNAVEKTLGRDPYTQESVWHDSDNDGVADAFELGFGNSASYADDYQRVSMRSYFFLGDGSSYYENLSYPSADFSRSIKPLDDDRYKVQFDGDDCYRIIEKRDDGIYVTELKCPSEGLRVEYTDFLIFPAEMTPGEAVRISAPFKSYINGQLDVQDTVTFTMTLIGQPRYYFDEKSYNAVEIMYGNSLEDTEIYAEGLGFVSNGDVQLGDFQVSQTDRWKDSSSGSGGGINLLWLLIGLTGVLITRRNR